MRLIEHYLSVQGEGLHSGELTYFVRFARCNLRCAWCDSTFTFGEGSEIDPKAVAKSIRESKAKFVCLTGGEPLLHAPDCTHLIRSFPQLHFDIETGGSLEIQPVQSQNSSVIMDWKLKHSGMNHKMKESNLFILRPTQDLLKFVTDGSDEEKQEILEITKQTEPFGFPVSLQPVFGTDPKPLAEWMIALKNPRLRINLQIHKVIWGAERVAV